MSLYMYKLEGKLFSNRGRMLFTSLVVSFSGFEQVFSKWSMGLVGICGSRDYSYGCIG